MKNPILRLDPEGIFREDGFWGLARATFSLYDQPLPTDPWVGYAGEYAPGLHWMGKTYFNFAEMEQYPNFIGFTAEKVSTKFEADFAYLKTVMSELKNVDIEDVVISGTPIGGYDITKLVGQIVGCRTIKLEKKVLKVGVKGQRDITELIMERYDIDSGTIVWGGEDVINNRASTKEQYKLYTELGAVFAGVISVLDRSTDQDPWFTIPETNHRIYTTSWISEKMDQFHQDNPLAAKAIAADNVFWKPKRKWEILKGIMQRAAQTAIT